ncbi:MAG: vWA domain-containing protein [Hyphomicrobiales bacterium]
MRYSGFSSSILRRFASETRGNVAIIFSLALIPMLLAGGAAVDIARAYVVENRMQSALDAAALAAASVTGVSDEERIETAEAVFAANYPDGALGEVATPSFDVEDGTVVASVDASLDTTLMQIAGITEMGVGASTEITIPSLKDGEIVLVLDYSGSMNRKGKYQTMRDAAIDLVETLSDEGENDQVKIGLVPFSQHVYVSLPNAHVAGQPSTGTWTGCTFDRKYPHNTQATTPTSSDDTKWGIEVDNGPGEHNVSNCNGYVSRDLVVRPLTDDHEGIVDQLEDMRPYAWTNIAIGMAFGWHLLTPNAPFAETTSDDNDELLQAVVLLTDGRQTQNAWDPGGSRSIANGESNLAAMCEDMKDQNILVITVAFELEDQDTEDRLRACASGAEYFYIAEDNAELSSSFKSITKQLAQQIFISK